MLSSASIIFVIDLGAMPDFPDAEEHARVILESVKGDYTKALV
jgi:hypothetical protein